jgi:phosphoglycerol transferase MdoB-like AlkP superfamily enzyme
MVLNMFCLAGILFVSFIVYIAGEEIELLHDLPEFSCLIFKQDISELVVLLPFVIQATTSYININIILSQTDFHTYISDQSYGTKILSALMVVQGVALLVVIHLFSMQITNAYHLVTNVLCLC